MRHFLLIPCYSYGTTADEHTHDKWQRLTFAQSDLSLYGQHHETLRPWLPTKR